jgi:hypothetical protein
MAEERTLGQLVAEASQDLSELVRYEVALATAEIKDDVIRGAAAGGMFGAAGYLGMLASVTIVITIGFALVSAGMSAWLAFLIVTIALLLLAAMLVVIGVVLLKRIRPPQRAIESTKLTIATVRGQRGTS